MRSPLSRPALAAAEAAHAFVQTDPVAASERAREALATARTAGDREAEAVALHALAFARYELGDPRTVRTFRAAVRTAERYGYPRRAALARRPFSVCLAYSGAIKAGLREIDLACAALDGLELAQAEVYRLALHGLAGRAPASLHDSNNALRILRRAGEPIWEARLLKNRGEMLAERGDGEAARPDFERARDLYAAAGATLGATGAEISLARLDLIRGDLVGCLAQLDSLERRALPPRAAWDVERIRAEALLSARLVRESREALGNALAVWEHSRNTDFVVKARLDVAQLLLLAGDAEAARGLAAAAQRSLAAAGQPVHAARAAGVLVSAAVESGRVNSGTIRSGRRAARTLANADWREESLRVRLGVARAATALGALRTAHNELSGAAWLRRRGTVADRIDAWHTEALLAQAEGDTTAVRRAVRCGLRLVDEHRAALGAADLRAAASALGSKIASIDLALALDSADPDRVFVTAERLRALALLLPPVRPPDDAELRASQASLRRTDIELQRARTEGFPTRSLIAQQRALETAIRRRARLIASTGDRARSTVGLSAVAGRLGAGSLAAYVESGGNLWSVTVRDGQRAVADLGPVARVNEQQDWLCFSLAHVARSRRRGPARSASLAAVEAAADELGRLLAPPGGADTLVVVPTGPLHSLPWSLLPSLRGRPVLVAPSATLWCRRRRAHRRGRKVVLVAGPGLHHSAAEVSAVADLHPHALVLQGRDAVSSRVLQALDGASIAHIACHGRFRADSPLFSSLELADGPLNVYDLQRLRRPPDVLVLSACDLALSQRHAGDELLGMAAVLLGMGTRTVVASVVAVPDAVTRRLMAAFHHELVAGVSPAAALAHAQAGLRGESAAAAGFVCLGSG